MNIRRIRQVCEYGWKDAIALSREDGIKKGKWSIFRDILYCFFKYNVWSNQYMKEKLYLLSGEQKKEICLRCQEWNNFRDIWVKEFFDNYKFLYKWSSFKYEQSAYLQAKRCAAYKKQYGLGENCFVGYDVILHKHHYVDAKIITGNDCLIAEQTNIDYTGGLTMEDHVSLSEGVKILTHNHDLDFNANDLTKGCILSPLVIHDHVWVGARAIIMPGVREIGRGAIISADAYVYSMIPPYAIVLGNPGKVVGFRLTPEELRDHEENLYPTEKRTDIEKYEKEYNKYFINRITDIKKYVNILITSK